MKLLLDENLPPKLAKTIADLFPGSTHVHECDLGASDDENIWSFAKKNNFVIASKDSDFHERSILYASPPKLIWLRTGNCSTEHLENLLRKHSAMIRRFEANQTESVLILP